MLWGTIACFKFIGGVDIRAASACHARPSQELAGEQPKNCSDHSRCRHALQVFAGDQPKDWRASNPRTVVFHSECTGVCARSGSQQSDPTLWAFDLAFVLLFRALRGPGRNPRRDPDSVRKPPRSDLVPRYFGFCLVVTIAVHSARF